MIMAAEQSPAPTSAEARVPSKHELSDAIQRLRDAIWLRLADFPPAAVIDRLPVIVVAKSQAADLIARAPSHHPAYVELLAALYGAAEQLEQAEDLNSRAYLAALDRATGAAAFCVQVLQSQ